MNDTNVGSLYVASTHSHIRWRLSDALFKLGNRLRMCFAPVSHCQYLIVCAARRHGKGSHFHPAPASTVTYPQSFKFISYPCIWPWTTYGLHPVRERSTLRHYLLILKFKLHTMPTSAILISHTYTNVPFFLFITCSSFKWSFELNLARTLSQYHYEALAAGHDAGLRLSCTSCSCIVSES